MSKRAVLLTSVPMLALALLAGCTSDDEPKTEPAPAAVDQADTLAAAGDQYEWDKVVEPCKSGELVVVQDVATADMTGDGAADSAVARACEGVDEYGPSTVEVFDGSSDPAAPRRLGILLSGDPDYPRRAKVTVSPDRTIVVKALGLQPESPNCCPDLEIVAEFAWRDGVFVSLKRQTRPV